MNLSESAFAEIFARMPDPVLIVAVDGRVRAANPLAETVFGYTKEELREVTIEALVPLRFRDKHVKDRKAYDRAPELRPMGACLDLFAVDKSGREFPVEISLGPVTLGGEPFTICTVRSLEAHRRIQHDFRQLIETAPDPIMVIGANGKIVRVNSQVETVFGYDRHELIGEAIEVLVPDRYRTGHVGHRGRYMAHPTVRPMGMSLDLKARRRDGSEIPVEISLSPLEDPQTGERSVIAIIRDLTGHKEAERQIRQKSEELARSNAELERFAYVTSHDLQAPLRSIAGFCHLLKESYGDRLGADADEYMGFMVEGVERMQMLIQDLLSYSRVATHGKELGPVETATAVKRALANLRSEVEEHHAEIEVSTLPRVLGDGSQLVHLFQNLIGNAIKFHGETPPKITVNAVREGTMWHFTVRDNGIGIEPQYAERIFIIFQRLHTRDQYAGTGIGLAICKKIVERHGGRIWLESQLGQGAAFHFTLQDPGSGA